MKYLKILVMMIFVLFLSGNSFIVLADNDDYEYGEHNSEEDEAVEEAGEAIGWGTVAFAGLAGLLLPLRRSGKQVKQNIPSMSRRFTKMTRFFGKWHITFGVTALLAAGGHGLLMYLAEGELEFRELIGIGSVILVLLAGIVGWLLVENKRSQSLRLIHISIISIAAVMAGIHILLS